MTVDERVLAACQDWVRYAACFDHMAHHVHPVRALDVVQERERRRERLNSEAAERAHEAATRRRKVESGAE